MKDFTINLNDSERITHLVFLLRRVGALEPRNLPDDIASSAEDDLERYTWTGQYRDIKVLDQLFQEDEEFITAMKDLIRIANDLDDLPTVYSDDSFSDYDVIHKDQDGESLTGISLFNTYKKHLELYNNLTNPAERIYARGQEAKEASKEIKETISNVQKKTFEIFVNTLGVVLAEKNATVIKTALDNNIKPNFAIKSWETKFANRPNCLFYTTTPEKQIMVMSGVRDFGSTRELELAELRSNNHIVVLNFDTEKTVIKKHPAIKLDKAGRRRKKAVEVTNFTNFLLPADIRGLAKPLQLAAQHLD